MRFNRFTIASMAARVKNYLQAYSTHDILHRWPITVSAGTSNPRAAWLAPYPCLLDAAGRSPRLRPRPDGASPNPMRRKTARSCIWCAAPHYRKALHCDDCHDKAVEWQAIACRQVALAVRAGTLPPPTRFRCVDCIRIASMYDHRNYSKPLSIEPVCRSCNAKRGPAEDVLNPGISQ